MKKIFFMFISLFLCFNFITKVHGQENNSIIEVIDNQIDLLDTNKVSSILGSSEKAYDFDFKELIKNTILGKIDISISNIMSGVLKIIFDEVYTNLKLIKQLIIIGILSAVLKALIESFESKAVGELGFYVCYISLVIVLFSSFKLAVEILENLVIKITEIIQASIPLLISALTISQNITGSYVYSTLLVFILNLVNIFMRDFFIPIIVLVSVVQIVNYLTENEMLSNLSEFIKKLVSWTLKGIAIAFISVLTIQKISAPIFNNLAVKTAKTTMNVVPVVGEVLTNSMDFILSWAQASRSGLLVALLIGIVSICAIPVLKLVALIIIYKFTAALIQPICDERIIKCIDTIGSYTGLLLGIGVTIVVMFAFSLMLMLSF